MHVLPRSETSTRTLIRIMAITPLLKNALVASRARNMSCSSEILPFHLFQKRFFPSELSSDPNNGTSPADGFVVTARAQHIVHIRGVPVPEELQQDLLRKNSQRTLLRHFTFISPLIFVLLSFTSSNRPCIARDGGRRIAKPLALTLLWLQPPVKSTHFIFSTENKLETVRNPLESLSPPPPSPLAASPAPQFIWILGKAHTLRKTSQMIARITFTRKKEPRNNNKKPPNLLERGR